MKNYEGDNKGGIIGHFGLGFYSAFMVAKKVTIETLSDAEGAAPVKWESEDGMKYKLSEGSRTAPRHRPSRWSSPTTRRSSCTSTRCRRFLKTLLRLYGAAGVF